MSFKVRAGQREFERGVDDHRIAGLLARRQYGKTTIGGRIALKKMMRIKGHTVLFGSVKLDLGREIVRKEAEQIQRAFTLLVESANAKPIDVVESGRDQSVLKLRADDFAELYEAQRLEFRYHHSNTVYSRTKVVALTPAAVGETGDLILDEVGRVKNFREVWEAVKPIIASNPDFRCILTTTPPPDDTHYSFELLAPPLLDDFPVQPQGNWYKSDLGVWVLRVTAWDAYADGVPLYDDDTGAPISPEESRARESDKDAWDRNYAVKFVIGGTAAVGLLQLDTAQRRGIGQCGYFNIAVDSDLDAAITFLTEHLGAGKVGIGFDVATTTKALSNPSAVTVREKIGAENFNRLIVTWKTTDPALAQERLGKIIAAVRARKEGGPARRLCIDATSERYFAQDCRTEFGAQLPVELVIASETLEVPGQPEPITMKQYLGSRLVAEFDDNHEVLPPERYIKEDFRLEKKEKGQFVCEPAPDGKHGDTFDSTKLADWALSSVFDSGPPVFFETSRRNQVIADRRERSVLA